MVKKQTIVSRTDKAVKEKQNELIRDECDERPGKEVTIGLRADKSQEEMLRSAVAAERQGSKMISVPRKERPSPRWDIYLARSTPAKLIGTVEASDADAAIEAAIREFHVTDQHAKRLIAVLRG
jgi:hypothetical protein